MEPWETSGEREEGLEAILLVGFPRAMEADLLRAPPSGGRIFTEADAGAALRTLRARAFRAVCLGPLLGQEAARSLLDRALELDSSSRLEILVLGAAKNPERYQELVDADRLFYLAQRVPEPTDMRAILQSAISRPRGGGPASVSVPILAVELVLRFLATLDEEADDQRVSQLCAKAIQALVDAEVAECLLVDVADSTLLGWGSGAGEARRESVAAGLVGWVARTGATIRLDEAQADPRYEPEADTSHGSPRDRFLAAPAAAVEGTATTAPVPEVRAVLVARRGAGGPPFDEIDQATLSLFGEHVASALGRMSMRRRLAGRSGSPGRDDLFREEALVSHAAEGGTRAQPLALAPGWTRRAYLLLLGVFFVALAFVSVGSVSHYAEGVGVVRMDDRTEVKATLQGIVDEAPIARGQTVEPGDLLVRLDATEELAELERVRGELERALIERLRDAGLRQGQGSVGSLREQLRLAEARLEERSVRAPIRGVVSERKVEVGEPLSPGQTLATLVPVSFSAQVPPSVIVLFPGRYRPRLEEGMALVLELEGHRGIRHEARIETVGDGIIGPSEARRILGAEIADAVPLVGPLVLVRARLSSSDFETDGRRFRYHDGLLGSAEVRLRSEGLLTSLVPGLEGGLGGSDG